MKKHSLLLCLFTLITCAPFGSTLAAEQTTAAVDMCHNMHKAKLKAKLTMLRAMQAPLAACSNRKVAIAAPLLGLSVSAATRIGSEILDRYVSKGWYYANALVYYVRQFCPFTWFCRYSNEYADKIGLCIALAPGVAAACWHMLDSICTSLENKIEEL